VTERIDLARLRWRCRRGLLELDVLFKDFLDRRYGSLDEAEREAFDRLLDRADQQLLAWFYGQQSPDDEELARLVLKIRD
jgi:antitoxin CptB